MSWRSSSPTPRRGDMWTCPACKARNEPSSASCINGCRQDGQRVRGPLAVPRPDQDDESDERGGQ